MHLYNTHTHTHIYIYIMQKSYSCTPARTQEIIHAVSSVLEDYQPPFSHGIADAAARELVSAAIERGATSGLAAVVVLFPWQYDADGGGG